MNACNKTERLTYNREQTSGHQQVGGWNKGQDW